MYFNHYISIYYNFLPCNVLSVVLIYSNVSHFLKLYNNFSNVELYLVLTYMPLLVLKFNQTFKRIRNWRWWLNGRNMSCFKLKVVHFLKNYLNNRVFLSRNYWLIVALQKFDVLKTNICPRSKASRANLLVLKTSNFWGAFMRLIVLRDKHY